MFEGPTTFGQEDEQLPEPFDYMAEARKAREEREAVARQERSEREDSRKRERESRLAKQLARSATKREENLKKLNESKADLKTKADNIKTDIEDVKKEIVETEKVIESDPKTDDKPVEMVFTNGSEYIDTKLENGSEATFDLNNSVKVAEEVVSTASEVLAQAEVLARARDTIQNVEKDSTNNAVIKDPEHLLAKEMVYSLGDEEDQIRQRIDQSWVGQENGDTSRSDVEPSTDTGINHDSGPSSESNLIAVGEQVVSSATTDIEKEVTKQTSKRPNTSSNLRNSAALAFGMFGNRSKRRENKLTQATESLKLDTIDLRKKIETIQQTAISQKPEFELPKTDIVTSGIEMAYPVYSTNEKELATMQGIEQSRSNIAAIPAWIRQLEVMLKQGKVPEIKKWQKDILRVQHPDLLKRYDKLDMLSKEAIKNHSIEHLKQAHRPVIKPLSAFEDAYSDAKQPSIPTFMQDGFVPRPMIQQSFSENTSPNGDSVATSNLMSIIMIGGVIFGAILILAFGL